MPVQPRWLALFTSLLIAAGAGAENPKVSLKLDRVTPSEAVAQLSKAAGVKVDLSPGQLQGAVPRPPGEEERVSFDWTNTTFARALRQFCEKYNLRPNRRPGGYTLYSTFQAPGAPIKKVGLTEKNGVRLYATGINMYESRNVSFNGNGADNTYSYFNLGIACELTDGDGETIAGVANVTGKDDLGNVITSDANRNYYSNGYGNGYPDEWTGQVALNPPHPKAKKIAWLEGDLMVYKSVRPVNIEIPLPFTGKSARKQVGDWTVVVSQYEASPKDEDDEADLPQIGPGPQAGGGPRMRVRVYYPNASRLLSRSGWGVTPLLVDQEGKVYNPTRNNSSGWGNGQMTMNDCTLAFPATTSPPAKLVWDVIERSEPVKLLRFRMSEVPVPAAQPFLPRKTAPPPEGQITPDPERPFYEKGGGILSNRIEVLHKPAGPGTLQLGLAPKTPAGWGPIRWVEVEVSPDGSARLEDVKPGTYRIQRNYRPKEAANLGTGGRWLNADAVVTLSAGKEAPLQPLRWTAAVPKSPAGGGKPRPRS